LKADFCVCFPGFSGVNCNTRLYGYTYASGLGTSGQIGDGSAITRGSIFSRAGGWYAFQYINMVAAGDSLTLTLTSSGVVHGFGDC
jgi:acyl dehydratase